MDNKIMRIIKQLEELNGTPQVYVKKPIPIRAVELDQEVYIETREGKLKGRPGDFIIEGIEGEIYPCDREIFFKTYKKQ